ncbi:MAG: BamA/OMP85 family outer membrane protein, partial [Vicinamibacteria bacterium]
LESEVAELTTRFDPDTAKLHLILAVDEGERFRVGDTVFSGADSLPEEPLRSEVQLEEGEPFQFLTHLQDRQRIATLYRREGFPDVRVRSSIERGEAQVDVVIEISEGERVRVGEIEIIGARATRQGVIRGALTFEPGDPLRLSDLTDTQSRLYNLGVFRSVDVRPEPTEDEDARDVRIEVTELPDLRFGYGARYSTEDHLEVTGDVELTNVLGTARQVGFHAFANRRLTEMRATVSIPSFFGRDVGSSLYVSRETEEGEGFESRAWGATFQQGRRVFSSVLAQWSFTHRQSSVTETVSSGPFGFDIEADRSVLSFSLIEDTRSSLTNPRSGRFWNATLQYAPEFLGSDLRFIKLYGQFFLYKAIWKDVIWASTYRAGIANGFSQVLLPTDRFRAGGPSSVRGYPVNELGPPDPLTGTVIGGEGVVIMNQELRIPLFWRFGGITFYDAGNVFLSGSDFNPLDLRHTTGLGLSVELPVGLVTVDWAVLLNPPPDLPKTRWHFTFGYSF